MKKVRSVDLFALIGLSMVFLVLVSMCCETTLHGEELNQVKYFKAKELFLDVGEYQGVNRDTYLEMDNPEEQLNYSVGLNWNVDLLCIEKKCLFWDNEVKGVATQRQFRRVGWVFDVGLNITGALDVFYHHRSEHSLDFETPNGGKYPLENVVGLRLHFLKGRK